jgi:SET domain-containing protein
VGFGLAISKEPPFGYGLRATQDIPSTTPITQYEGILISRDKAESIRKGKQGKILGSHFATTSARRMVINGYSFDLSNGDHSSSNVQGGVPLTELDWKGRGGGSICNHAEEKEIQNAELVRDISDDGYGIFIVSTRDIRAGELIHVDYGKRFLKSVKANI